MFGVIISIHILACLMLIGIVLLQQGKGADMGAVFGGSSSTVFGSGGAGNFLTRLTAGCAIVFMLTSLSLTYIGARGVTSTVFDSALPEPPPLEAPAASEPGAAAPAPAPQAESAAAEVAPAAEPAAEAPPAPAAPAEPAPAAAAPAAEAAPAEAHP
jgi:preprotein translocase subunit SecG